METHVPRPKGVSMTILDPALQSPQPGETQTFGGITIHPLCTRPVSPAVTLLYPIVHSFQAAAHSTSRS